MFRYLNASGLWLALGGALMSCEYFAVQEQPIALEVVLQTFFLVLSAYLFLKKEALAGKRALQLLAVTGLVVTFGYDPFFNWKGLALAGLIVLFYNLDWMRELGWKVKFDLRKIVWLKPVLISSAWTIVVASPYFESEPTGRDGLFEQLIMVHFLWITGLAMAGDIRDIGVDAPKTTAADFMGLWPSKILSVLFCLSAVWVMTNRIGEFNLHFALPLGVPILLSAAQILVIGKKWNWNVQTFLLDGWLVVQGAAVLKAFFEQ